MNERKMYFQIISSVIFFGSETLIHEIILMFPLNTLVNQLKFDLFLDLLINKDFIYLSIYLSIYLIVFIEKLLLSFDKFSVFFW